MKQYITTAIPYVNGDPHLGHALEFVQADVMRRLSQIRGNETLLLSGSDENALKNVQAAEKAGTDVQAFVDENARKFQKLATTLNVQFDIFQKGSNPDHMTSSQKLWRLCEQAGDIYKDTYSGLYCVGCEAFYQPDELNEQGECFEHPGKPLEEVTEENYYFRLSKYQDRLVELIKSRKLKITPVSRENEVLSFLSKPLEDISISRTTARAKNWGVPVPDDDNQRMYVWFDALNIYQSGVGFGIDEKTYNKWWPADIHVIGKGIIRFHAVYWPAFLMSAGLKLPQSLFVHGYFTINGQKMSKSLGNVIDPFKLVETYGVDAIRYYLLREIPATSDGDFSLDRMNQVYESDLANELGNLLSRITTLAATDEITMAPFNNEVISTPLNNLLSECAFHEALELIWQDVKGINKEINEQKPWALSADERKAMLTNWLTRLHHIGSALQPLLPDTAQAVIDATSDKISKIKPLFPRIS